MWGIHLELMCATFSFWGSYLLCHFKLWLLRFFFFRWDMSKPWMFCLCCILSSVIRRVLGYASENVCQCKCALLFTQVVMWENQTNWDKNLHIHLLVFQVISHNYVHNQNPETNGHFIVQIRTVVQWEDNHSQRSTPSTCAVHWQNQNVNTPNGTPTNYRTQVVHMQH